MSIREVFRQHRNILIIVICYVLFSVALLDVFPPPWSDEMLFALPAHSLFQSGEVQTPVVMGMEHYTFWMPPAYFVALGLFFEAFGFSFVSMRLFSILCGSIVLILTYTLGKQLKLPSKFLIIAIVLVVVDPFFLRYSKMGRMDSFTLMWILLSLAAHIEWLDTRKRGWNILAITAATLSVAAHPFGVVAPLGIALHRMLLYVRKEVSLLSLCMPVIAVFILLLILSAYWLQNIPGFVAQTKFQFVRKAERGTLPSFFNWLSRYRSLPALLVGMIVGLMLTVLKTTRQGWFQSRGAIAIFALLSFIVAVRSFELFYPLYYVPFVALCISVALQDEFESWNNVRAQIGMIIVVVMLINAALFDGYFVYMYLIKLKDKTSSQLLTRDASNLIPQHSTILLIGSPNLYSA